MRELFKKYWVVIRFILLFMGAYLLFSILYSFYLQASIDSGYFPDYITNIVALQSQAILEAFGFASNLSPSILEQGMLLTVNSKYTVSIVEGCNSISVIILFISFIIAFAEKFKKTFLFLLAGAVLVYIVNLLRIVILIVALYKFPQFENVLHSIVFPGIIYGIVFVLWMIWVRMLKPINSK